MPRTIQIKAIPPRFNPKTGALPFKGKTDYTKPSDSRRRKVTISKDGRAVYTSAPLTAGNSKLAKNVLIFDLLAIYTCPNCKQCRADCYALKAQRQYPDTWNKRLINTRQAQHDLNGLEADICAQLAKSDKPFIRIHSSGDFFNQAYADMWARIAARFPEKQFYTYTKSPFRPKTAANLNIVESVLPDGRPNFGPLDEIKARLAKVRGAFLCPYGVDEHSDPVHCGTTCTACMHCRYVGFKQH